MKKLPENGNKNGVIETIIFLGSYLTNEVYQFWLIHMVFDTIYCKKSRVENKILRNPNLYLAEHSNMNITEPLTGQKNMKFKFILSKDKSLYFLSASFRFGF